MSNQRWSAKNTLTCEYCNTKYQYDPRNFNQHTRSTCPDQKRLNAIDKMRAVWVVQVFFHEMTDSQITGQFITIAEVPYTFEPSQVDGAGRFISNAGSFCSDNDRSTPFSHAQLVRRVNLDEFGF